MNRALRGVCSRHQRASRSTSSRGISLNRQCSTSKRLRQAPAAAALSWAAIPPPARPGAQPRRRPARVPAVRGARSMHGRAGEAATVPTGPDFPPMRCGRKPCHAGPGMRAPAVAPLPGNPLAPRAQPCPGCGPQLNQGRQHQGPVIGQTHRQQGHPPPPPEIAPAPQKATHRPEASTRRSPRATVASRKG